MSSLLRSVQIFPDLKGAHDPDLSYKKFDEVQHQTSIYVAAEDIPAGTEITDPRWVVKLDNSAAYAAEQAREEAEALRVAADAARMGFVPRGPYIPTNENKYGEWYTHEGGSWGYIWPEPSTGVPLTDASHWQQIASVGGQDLVDVAVAARDAAQAQAALAQGYAVQLAAGLLRPKGVYADLSALTAGTPTVADTNEIYITLDDGKWCYHNGVAWVAGGQFQAASVVGDIANLTSQLAEIATAVTDHEISTTPHTLHNYQTGKDMRYGFKIDADGVMQIVLAEIPDTVDTIIYENMSYLDIFETHNLLLPANLVNSNGATNIAYNSETGIVSWDKLVLANTFSYARQEFAAFTNAFLCFVFRATTAFNLTVAGAANIFTQSSNSANTWYTKYFLGAAAPKTDALPGVRYEFSGLPSGSAASISLDFAKSVLVDTSIFSTVPTVSELTTWHQAYLTLKEGA